MIRSSLALALLAAMAVPVRAELKPEDLVLLTVASSPESKKLAEHYAEVRGVPKSQILALDIPSDETISRDLYERKVRPEVLAWLKSNELKGKVRCIVSCWNVPLRIAPRDSSDAVVRERTEQLTLVRSKLVSRLHDTLVKLDTVAADGKAEPRVEFPADTDLARLTKAFDLALSEAQARFSSITDAEAKSKAAEQIEQAIGEAGGIAGLLRVIASTGNAVRLPAETVKKLDILKGVSEGVREGLQALNNLPDSVSRDAQMHRLVLKSNGFLGAIQWIDLQQDQLAKNETAAAFDSELTMLYWPEYPLFATQANLLHYKLEKLAIAPPQTLMVARLDAPSFELAMKLVDTAIEVEKDGLTGKVYLDARGIKYDPKRDQPGSVGEYDQSLRDLAERLQKHSKLEVVLDDKPGLFQKGECPEAALYCGWSSPARYIDAFAWRPGAVGYHIAGAEAETLRQPGNTLWCNAMLERGVVATLGPCFDPGAGAFPLPDDFFSLLMTGHYTLAEVYFRTLPANSWAMVLVGDPLYNPFKKKPALVADALPERLK